MSRLVIRSKYSNETSFVYMINYVIRERLGFECEILHDISETASLSGNEKLIRWHLGSWDNLQLPKKITWVDGIPLFDFTSDQFDLESILKIDFFYYAFLILSRYEEHVLTDKDIHGRFPLSASLAYKFGYYEIPVVDIYVDLIRQWIEMHLGLESKAKPEFQYQISFDIDQPRNPAYDNLLVFLKAFLLGRVPFRPDLIGNSKKFYDDPFFSFSYLFEKLTPRHNTHVFFITDRHNRLDGGYSMKDYCIRELQKIVSENGYIQGVHGSYNSYDNHKMLRNEREKLNRATNIRQHFLRFNINTTWEEQQVAGFTRDWSLGFAEAPGFRAGTSHAFKPYSFTQKKALDISVEPLLLMDVSLTEKKYLGLLSTEQMLAKARPIFFACKKYGGHFNILFHNPTVLDSEVKAFYEEILSW